MSKNKYKNYPLRKGFNDALGYYTDREPLKATSTGRKYWKKASAGHVGKESEFRMKASFDLQCGVWDD